MALAEVNWRALAESLGLVAFTAGNDVELVRAIDAASTIDGPTLIDA